MPSPIQRRQDGAPRPFIACMHEFQMNQRIMQLAREKGPLSYRGSEIHIYVTTAPRWLGREPPLLWSRSSWERRDTNSAYASPLSFVWLEWVQYPGWSCHFFGGQTTRWLRPLSKRNIIFEEKLWGHYTLLAQLCWTDRWVNKIADLTKILGSRGLKNLSYYVISLNIFKRIHGGLSFNSPFNSPVMDIIWPVKTHVMCLTCILDQLFLLSVLDIIIIPSSLVS